MVQDMCLEMIVMTIKRQWLLILILIAVFSVTVNAFILSALTDRYFKGYMTENYEKHFNEIVEYSKKALAEKDFSVNQMAIELETHLDEPITRIKLYNENGELIVDVSADHMMMGGMMNRGMMGRMMNAQFEEVDNAELFDNDRLIGHINITRYSSVGDSMAAQMFKGSLILNSFYSIIIVLAFTILIGIFVSKKMSKDLVNTATMAQSIEVGREINIDFAKSREIRTIQQSLESLSSRLKLKQKSRKTLVDELVHQTRTPLTILRNYLEGFEDGVIDMTSEEIRVCENQIENVTAIISNIRGMIDADKDDSSINIEEFEFSSLIKQIVNGLKVQFEQKKIRLNLMADTKVALRNDKYKLSQAIYNILTNAYKFTQENGNVNIYYHVSNNQLVLNIEDDGIGISEKEILKIFEAYYSGDKASSSASEGLGLYIAKDNISRINGAINVESKLNIGSKFIITLPLSI